MAITMEELQQEIQVLKKELAALKADMEIVKLGKNMLPPDEEHDYYFYPAHNTAICPKCWETQHKISPVHDHDENGYFTCHTCGYQGIYERTEVDEVDAMQTSMLKRLYDDK